MAITKEQFKAYEKVRQSGKTNMFDAGMVCKLSHGVLDRQDVAEIIQNYTELNQKYPDVRGKLNG